MYPIACRTRWAYQFFYGLSSFNNASGETMPQYVKEFYFYLGVLSLSSDFNQAGCPGSPPGDFASKFYAQVPSCGHTLHRTFGRFRASPLRSLHAIDCHQPASCR
jgi:hypothetical protein